MDARKIDATLAGELYEVVPKGALDTALSERDRLRRYTAHLRGRLVRAQEQCRQLVEENKKAEAEYYDGVRQWIDEMVANGREVDEANAKAEQVARELAQVVMQRDGWRNRAFSAEAQLDEAGRERRVKHEQT